MVALASDPVKERQDRLAEVAEILAAGLLRRWRARPCPPPENRQFPRGNYLEVTAKTSPDVAAN